MKRLLLSILLPIIFVVFSPSNFLFAQGDSTQLKLNRTYIIPSSKKNTIIDSLETAYSQVSEDTSKILILTKISKQLVTKNHQTTKELIHYIINRSNEIGFKYGIAEGYSLLQDQHLTEANYFLALDASEQAEKLFLELNDEASIIKLYDNDAIIYHYLNQHTQAIKKLRKSIYLCEKLGLTDRLPAILNNLSGILIEIGKYDEAKETLNRFLLFVTEKNDFEDMVIAYNNLGIASINKKEYEKAIEIYKDNLERIQTYDIQNYESSGICFTNLATAYNELKDFKKAVFYLKKALKHYKTVNDKNHDKLIFINLSKCYYNLNDFNKAQAMADTVLLTPPFNTYSVIDKGAYEVLYNINKNQNNFQEALRLKEKMDIYNDSIQIRNKRSQLTLLKSKFNHLKEKEKLELSNHLKAVNQKRTDLSLLLSSALIIIIIFLFIQKSFTLSPPRMILQASTLCVPFLTFELLLINTYYWFNLDVDSNINSVILIHLFFMMLSIYIFRKIEYFFNPLNSEG